MDQYRLACEIAGKFHAGQLYGRQPYMYHLDMVARSLENENDDRLPVIGMLHDILEDTTCTSGLLYNLFDKDIVKAVEAVAKLEGEPYAVYIATVKSNKLALVVKMHDSLCNLTESLLRRDTKRIIKYSKQLQLLAE